MGESKELEGEIETVLKSCLEGNLDLEDMEMRLDTRTFLVGHHITAADIYAYPILSLDETHINLKRWRNHIESLPHLETN